MSNPMLEPQLLPAFSLIKPDHIEEAIDQLLADNRAEVANILEQLSSSKEQPSWESLVAPMEEMNDRLAKAWSPVSHMNSVVNSDELRDAYNACIPKLSQYWTEMGQNQALYQAFNQLSESENFQLMDEAQQKVISNTLRDFRLSGIALNETDQARYAELQQKLSELTTKFSENVLDASNAWSKLLTQESDLEGLPPMALGAAKQMAEAKGEEGWLVTLDFPSYLATVTYADNRELRKEIYTAFATRASDQGPGEGQWDNSSVMTQILELRLELAKLLGFENYAEYSLATKMAETSDQVVSFLNDLAEKSLPVAKKDYQQLCDFAKEQHGIEDLQAWDLAYYSDKLKQAEYSISEEQIRPYFPLPKVLNGLFTVTGKLFDIQISEVTDFDRWHEDARLFEISHEGEVIARFFLDLYAREKKRGGAWMDDCRVRRRLDDGALQLPVAYLVCNFSSPVGDDPALLTHNEVTTMFHEFGHGLHHMLTQIESADVSGINGVAWDAVELPSQFLENWCYEPEALALISGHYQTGEALPQPLLDKMLAARNFQSGMMMMRQIEFSLFDFCLHREYEPGVTDVQSFLNDIRAKVAVIKPPAFNRFQHSFSHIFAGGYAAGYYSYKWAEVLSADAFSRFEEEGVFNLSTGTDFRKNILEMGGSKEPMELFIAFRGREPKVDALLRHCGIQS
ncbi:MULTISPECIES: oligopeptidase A [unclassified Neptuniibacter]|uniref:oligopeptidase A n=1 Tax=unclassified Neptuniibacter TaxID=2630693 RepID=UPI000C4F8E67|nr:MULTISPECIES: oligopeptidase A [unclassified Neptuniibacter]MAY42687.1 oligopeptidase A [Oceanospirillaceae bacterium]|tara:strand:- start:15820 stop:17868 length:2049 start_codon:yes stop_codon:yes gene_type:complete